jgi:hypothetical protein
MVERAVVPPEAQIGPISDAERSAMIKASLLAGYYEALSDRESAYEKIKGRIEQQQAQAAQPAARQDEAAGGNGLGDILGGIFGNKTPGKGRQRQGVAEAMVKSAVRTMGSKLAGRSYAACWARSWVENASPILNRTSLLQP